MSDLADELERHGPNALAHAETQEIIATLRWAERARAAVMWAADKIDAGKGGSVVEEFDALLADYPAKS